LKNYLLIILFSFSCILQSQEQEQVYNEWREGISRLTSNDSIINYSKNFLTKVSDPHKIQIYNSIALSFGYNAEEDSTLFYFDKAITLGKTLSNSESLLFVHSSKSGYFFDKEDYDRGEKSITAAEPYYNKNKNSKFRVEYYGQLSRLKHFKGLNEESYEYMDKAIKLAVKTKDSASLPNLHHNLGIQYFQDSKFEAATKSFLEALKLKEEQKLADIDVTYYVLGYSYYMNENTVLAKKYLKKGLLSSKRSGNIFVEMLSHSMLAKLYRHENVLDKTIKHLDSAKIIAGKNHMIDRVAQIEIEMGLFYLKSKKDNEKAQSYFDSAYKIAKDSDIPHVKRNAINALFDLNMKNKNYTKAHIHLKLLEEAITSESSPTIDDKQTLAMAKGKYFKATKQYKKSLDNYLLYQSLKDSINSVATNTKIAELEKQYDTQNKELTIVKLGKDKKEQELLTQEAKVKQNLFLIVAVFLTLLLLLGLWGYRKLKKQRNELATAHDRLSEMDVVKNRLFSIIAHDLRGMLIPFQRAGKVLSHHIKKENYNRVESLSQDLQENSQSLSFMLDNLLNWSLEQMNGYSFKNEAFSVKKELEIIISSFNQYSKYKNTTLALINK